MTSFAWIFADEIVQLVEMEEQAEEAELIGTVGGLCEVHLA